MKVSIDKEKCIGCGACASMSSTVFEIGDDGLAVAKVSEVPAEVEEDVTNASESCPTDAIEVK